MRTTLSTESRDCSASSCSFARSSPTTPMIVRTSPRERWVRNPKSLTRRETSSMSASLDRGFMTMIMSFSPLAAVWSAVYFFKPFSCGGPDMAPALPPRRTTGAAGYPLLLQALQLRGPRHGPRTPPLGGPPWAGENKNAAGLFARGVYLVWRHGLVRRPWLLAFSSWEPGGERWE